jgi:RNA polymerase sigma-70 factor (ECF subfamily)
MDGRAGPAGVDCIGPDAAATGGLDQNFRDLLRRVREGSEDAALELVEQYGDSIRRAVRRVLHQKLRSKFDSLDFVQIVWSSVFRSPGFLDRCTRPEDLAAYLVTMARNKVGMEVRRRMVSEKYNVNRETSLERGMGPCQAQLSDSEPGPMDVAIAREKWRLLLEDQPPSIQRAAQLRLEGRTWRQIAEELHLDETTIRRFFKRLDPDADL